MGSFKKYTLDDLRSIIHASGYKPYILSEKLGHSKSAIYNWLNGVTNPSAKDMLGLTKLLNVDASVILKIFGEK